MMIDFNSKEYKRSRSAYIIQSIFEYFLVILVGDAFLAKLLTHLGISDAVSGIIASFVNVAYLFQVFSLLIAKWKINKKTFLIAAYIISFSSFGILFLIPFMPMGHTGATVTVMLCVLLGYLSLYVVASIMFRWANSYVDPNKRASFGSTREIISLLSGIVFSTVMGAIINKYESLHNLQGGLLFIAVCILVFSICNLICMIMIKGEAQEQAEEKRVTIKQTIKYISQNRDFKNVILMTILNSTSMYFTIGFMGVFKTNDLRLSVLTIQIINVCASFVRMLLTRPIGKFSDKYSFAKGFRIGLYLLLGAFVINIFTVPETWYLVIAFTVLQTASLAGTNMNSYNITYSYVDREYITQAMAIKTCIGGVFGLVASLLGGRLLSLIQANGNMVFRMHMYGQQVLSVISSILIVINILFVKFVIEKQDVMKQ